MTIEAINGSVVCVYAGIPMLIKIANSMTATRMIGSDTDLNTSAIITKIAPIDDADCLKVLIRDLDQILRTRRLTD